eukprot:TRINITY_DN493_c0_g1_i1.p1 TRINITY_DN493_c0_g1~~TRINITY_DN493_c0_g1_i1.p1  ORF type:complete len:1278 (-),score=243.32 TRINITY_DN493_c0_g1_i1:3837-7670(-)
MNLLKVTIDQSQGMVSVWNNGKGIPCVMHKEHGVYIPELIFGHLLTSSNYNDTQKKVTGGRNGYGAKLTNIFSKRFIVEAADEKNGKLFVQEYTDNMSKKSEPKITKHKGKDYTCITFYPDLARFGMTHLDDDMVSLMYKRVYDIAGITPDKVTVFLNGEKLKVRSFSQYVDYYLKSSKRKPATVNPSEDSDNEESEDLPKIFEQINERWEVCVSMSDGQFQQVSFVNGICTVKGGTHVNAITDQVVDSISAHILKKNKLDLKPHQVKAHLWVFVNSLIENPTFDSQTKETLTLKPTAFGSEFKISDGFLKKVLGCGIVETLVAVAQAKDKANMAKQLKGKKRGRLLGIEKLEDANWAGTKRSHECVLIVTEGDSAKGLAMNGVEVLGRDRYGVFPLRGKLLNVRDAKSSQVRENKEINDMIQIFGLQFGAIYEDIKSLRYGALMIMTDQDVDGSHIKGLVINFFQSFWPSLFQKSSFLTQFITPIIKATKGKEVHQFFTIPEYEAWAKDRNLSGYKIKYYKGLGTSTPQEAKEYFRNIDKHRLAFEYVDEEDDGAILMAFGKKHAEKRKDWINSYQEGTYIDYNQPQIRYKDFVDRELILFSMYDNMRSIPSVCDGLKPGQRKILFSCFKRNLKGEIKVAQLSGYVSEHSAYHHGEASLASTIIGMAQNFVGSNNINLLLPIGQFGTRHMGGKEAASPRYIYTSLSKLARTIFRAEDDALMKYQIEEGQKIEPEWYLPIIPMILVNGAEGIGTGWRTTIPNYNPREIVANLFRRMKGEEFERMYPWFKNYTGKIVPNDIKKEGGFTCYGAIQIKDEETVVISELPIRKWTRDYKTFLEECFEGAPKEKETKEKKGKETKKKNKKGRNGQPKKKKNKEPKADEGEGGKQAKKKHDQEIVVEDIKEYHIGNRIHFEVKIKKDCLAKLTTDNALIKGFKLSSTIPTTQYVCFDHFNKIKRYVDEREIMEEFYHLRLQFYEKRKVYLLKQMKRDLGIIDNKVRFILGVINEEVVVKRQKRKVLVKALYEMKFTPYSQFSKDDSEEEKRLEKLLLVAPAEGTEENTLEKAEAENEEKGLPVPAKEYDYLLSLPLWSLTYEKVEELLAKKREKEAEIVALEKMSAIDIWTNDLNDFIKVLDEVERAEEAQLEKDLENAAPVKDGKGNKARKPRKKKEGKENGKATKKGKKKGKAEETNEDPTKDTVELEGEQKDLLGNYIKGKQLEEHKPGKKRMKLAENIGGENITLAKPMNNDIVPAEEDDNQRQFSIQFHAHQCREIVL